MVETIERTISETGDRILREAGEFVLAVVMRDMGLSKEEAIAKFHSLSEEDKQKLSDIFYTSVYDLLKE